MTDLLSASPVGYLLTHQIGECLIVSGFEVGMLLPGRFSEYFAMVGRDYSL